MARWLYLLTAFAGLAAWAGAQNPAPPLSAEDKLRLLKANSTLIENLVNDGVALSVANTPEDRAVRCHRTSLHLANEIERAAKANDKERVAELTGLFCDQVRDGLVPTINDGLRTVNPVSPAATKLREVRQLAGQDVARVQAAVPTVNTLTPNNRNETLIRRLDEVAGQLTQ
jgi:hypothetical protein